MNTLIRLPHKLSVRPLETQIDEIRHFEPHILDIIQNLSPILSHLEALFLSISLDEDVMEESHLLESHGVRHEPTNSVQMVENDEEDVSGMLADGELILGGDEGEFEELRDISASITQ
jgi:hypothetical protein